MICSNEPTCMIICKVHARLNSMRVTDCDQMDRVYLVHLFPKAVEMLHALFSELNLT